MFEKLSSSKARQPLPVLGSPGPGGAVDVDLCSYATPRLAASPCHVTEPEVRGKHYDRHGTVTCRFLVVTRRQTHDESCLCIGMGIGGRLGGAAMKIPFKMVFWLFVSLCNTLVMVRTLGLYCLLLPPFHPRSRHARYPDAVVYIPCRCLLLISVTTHPVFRDEALLPAD